MKSKKKKGRFLMLMGSFCIAGSMLLALHNVWVERQSDKAAQDVLVKLNQQIPSAAAKTAQATPGLIISDQNGVAIDWPLQADGLPMPWPVNRDGVPEPSVADAAGRVFIWEMESNRPVLVQQAEPTAQQGSAATPIVATATPQPSVTPVDGTFRQPGQSSYDAMTTPDPEQQRANDMGNPAVGQAAPATATPVAGQPAPIVTATPISGAPAYTATATPAAVQPIPTATPIPGAPAYTATATPAAVQPEPTATPIPGAPAYTATATPAAVQPISTATRIPGQSISGGESTPVPEDPAAMTATPIPEQGAAFVTPSPTMTSTGASATPDMSTLSPLVPTSAPVIATATPIPGLDADAAGAAAAQGTAPDGAADDDDSGQRQSGTSPTYGYAAEWATDQSGNLLPYASDGQGRVIPWLTDNEGHVMRVEALLELWDLLLEQLNASWEAQLSQPAFITNPDMQMPITTLDGHDYIGVLEIPSQELTLPIMSSWSYAKLKIAPCRYRGSVYAGDAIFAGHNSNGHFSPIKKLVIGDEVRFTDADGNVFYYKVIRIDVIDGNDVWSMVNGSNVWDLSLFTCSHNSRKRTTVRCVLESYLAVDSMFPVFVD